MLADVAPVGSAVEVGWMNKAVGTKLALVCNGGRGAENGLSEAENE